MLYEPVINGTPSPSFLDWWERIAVFVAVGYAAVAASRLATRPRRLPLISTRGFIAIVALPAVLGLGASYLDISNVTASAVSDPWANRRVAGDLLQCQVLLLVGVLSSLVIAGAGLIRPQVAADGTAPLWTVVTPGLLLIIAELTLVLLPEHTASPYAWTISAAGAVASFLLLVLLTVFLFRSQAAQDTYPYGRLALAIRMLPLPLATAVYLVSTIVVPYLRYIAAI